MAASSTSNSSTQTISKRNVPKNFSDLLDLAIFSFSCQSGLRANHKIRGDPVLEGVSAFLGRLISCSSQETMTEFEEFSPGRLGNWRPGQSPTKELLGLISSRLKTLKKNGTIRENSKPVVPSVLVDKVERFCEEEDRVKARFYSKCWRCGTRCEFCLAKKKTFPKFGNFNVDLASPFLDVLEELLSDEEDDDDSDNDAQEETGSESDDGTELLKQCTSDIDFPESDEDEGNGGHDEGENGSVPADVDESDAMEEDGYDSESHIFHA